MCPYVDWEKEAIVVVDIHISFKSQIFGFEPIAVQTAITAIGSKSFELVQRVVGTNTVEE